MTGADTSTTTTQETSTDSVASVASISVSIAGIDVPMPNRFVSGHVLTDAEAKVTDAAFRRQFKNNQDAAHEAWVKKVTSANGDKAKLAAIGPNPCTVETMLALYANYTPNVGGERASSAEKNRYEAGYRLLVELMAEHNVKVEEGSTIVNGVKTYGQGTFWGSNPVQMPRANKTLGVTAEAATAEKDALVAKLLASPRQAERIQRHLDIVIVEQEAKKVKPMVANANVASAASADF